jgi:hypothetical protein
MSYCILSWCHVERARAELDSALPSRLFYAALELRLGIEARMREYLEMAPGTKSLERGNWKIAHLGGELDRVFSGDRAARLTFRSVDLDRPVVLVYSPVSRALRKAAERLGDYLHAQKEPPSQDWLDSFRSFLEDTYAKLRLANAGTLMGPPLREKASGQMRLTMQLTPELSAEIMQAFKPGSNQTIEVRYLDELTAEEVEETIRTVHGG